MENIFVPFAAGGNNIDLSVLEHVYISQANGNNANSGNTPAEAIADINSYIARYPVPPITGRIFHFDSGVHPVTTGFPPGWGRYAPIILSGDGAGQAGDDGFDVLAAVDTAQAGTTTSMLVASGNVAVALTGAIAEITTGGNTVYRQIFRINDGLVDGTDIYLTYPVAGLAAGDTFRIVEAAALLTSASPIQFFQNVGMPLVQQKGAQVPTVSQPSVIINNIAFDFDASPNSMSIISSEIYGWGVEVEASQAVLFPGSTIFAGPSEDRIADSLIGYISQISATVPQNATDLVEFWGGWGLRGRAVSLITYLARFQGYVVASTITSLFTTNAFIKGGGTTAGSYLHVEGSVRLIPEVGWFSIGQLRVGGTTIAESAPSFTIQATSGTVDFLPQSGNAALVNIGGVLFSQGDNATFITIDPADTPAVLARYGGQVFWDGSPTVEGTNPGVTDIQVDDAAPVAFATLAASFDVIIENLAMQQRV